MGSGTTAVEPSAATSLKMVVRMARSVRPGGPLEQQVLPLFADDAIAHGLVDRRAGTERDVGAVASGHDAADFALVQPRAAHEGIVGAIEADREDEYLLAPGEVREEALAGADRRRGRNAVHHLHGRPRIVGGAPAAQRESVRRES